MRRCKVMGRLWLTVLFWMFALGGCAPFADYKMLRRTVPWVAPQFVPWSAERMASSICPDIGGVYRRGVALNNEFPGYGIVYEDGGINLNPVVVTLQASKEPIAVPELPSNYTKEQWIAMAKERTRQQQAFYAKSIAYVSHEAHSLVIRVTDNEQYNRVASIDLRQAGIGCSNGALIIRQFAGGQDTHEGKAPRSIRAKETQFRVLPNGNLEVVNYDLDWYGENTRATDWKKRVFIYERMK